MIVSRCLAGDSPVGLKSLINVKKSMRRGGWLKVVVIVGNIGAGQRTSAVYFLSNFNDEIDYVAIKNHGSDLGHQCERSSM